MKDITSTSFGLLIAFEVPGLAGIYIISLYCPTLATMLSTLMTTETNVGAFVLVLLAGLALGLQLTLVRWLIFECILTKERIDAADFEKLTTEPKLAAFRASVDEHYRYHQFWGGLFVVMLGLVPILLRGLSASAGPEFWMQGLKVAAFVAVEALTMAGAVTAYTRYVARAKKILTGA